MIQQLQHRPQSFKSYQSDDMQISNNVELSTFSKVMALLGLLNKANTDYFHQNVFTKKVSAIMGVLVKRNLITDQPVQMLLQFNYEEVIGYLHASQNEIQNSVLGSLFGLYPSFVELNSSIQIPQVIPHFANVSGNKFWILSQNALWSIIYSQQYKDIKQNMTTVALIYAFLAGNQYEILSIFHMLDKSWCNILWAKLYCYYRQQIILRIINIQKQNNIQPIQPLDCLENQYDLNIIDWNEIIRVCQVNQNSLDYITFSIIKSIITQTAIDMYDIVNQLERLASVEQYKQIALNAGTLLYQNNPQPHLQRVLVNLARQSSHQEAILPAIYSSNEQIKRSYFDRNTPIDPLRISKFKDPKLKNQISKHYLESSQRKSLCVVQGLTDDNLRLQQLLKYLPEARITEVPQIVRKIKDILYGLKTNTYITKYQQICSNYTKINDSLNFDHPSLHNFSILYDHLASPYSQILSIKPPQYNSNLLKQLIIAFYQNALYLVQTQTVQDKRVVFQKSKLLIEEVQPYIHNVLSQKDIKKTLHKGLFDILIRDSSIINDVQQTM